MRKNAFTVGGAEEKHAEDAEDYLRGDGGKCAEDRLSL